ncbi:hypothetical protein ACVW0K_005148 [Streptomyces filamentosus]
MDRVYAGVGHLHRHLHEVPAYVIPCVEGRTEGLSVTHQAGTDFRPARRIPREQVLHGDRW